jgi:hypothetical protein
MAITFSDEHGKPGKPNISRRPDILPNGEQRLNPDTKKPVWIPQICVKLENDAAPNALVCVTIYRIKRTANGGEETKVVCNRRTVVKAPVGGAFGSIWEVAEVCCDLDYVPEVGDEFYAVWDNAGPPPCGPVPAGIGGPNRSDTLRVAEVLKLAMLPGEELRHSAIIGVAMADVKGKPNVQVATMLPAGWKVQLPEKPPETFPAVLAFTVTARPGAFLNEAAEIRFRVVDKGGNLLDQVAYRFVAVPDPDRPKLPDEEDGVLEPASSTSKSCGC